MNNIYNKENFPASNDINMVLHDFKFNELLNTIFWKIISANNMSPIGGIPFNNMNNFIKINNNDTIQYTPYLIDDVKNFLTSKGYKIIDIEDNNNNNIGWKLLW